MGLDGYLAQVDNDIAEIKSQMLALVTRETDNLDSAKNQELTGVLQAQLLMKQAYRTKVITAIQRKARGEFGSCDECGFEIEEKRLFINPAALCCAQCQEYREIQAKRLGVHVDSLKQALRPENIDA